MINDYLRPMRSTFLLTAVLFFSSLAGQDAFLRSLAVEVCDCLTVDGTGISDTLAYDCLATVAGNHEKKLLQGYDLVVGNANQRDLLSELIIDDLLDVCPVLRTVRPEEDQREFRWADGRRNRKPVSPVFSAPKGPPADTATTVAAEPPAVWRATGILLAQPGSNGLRLRTKEGEEMRFDLPAAAARKRDFDRGDEVTLSYRREWRLAEMKIVLVIIQID